MCKANKQVFNDYGVNLTDSVTISGLALRIFLKDFYKENIPSITKASMYNDIKQAYYGGITEVYKPYGYNITRYKLEDYFKEYNLFPCGESLQGSLRGIPQGLDEDIVYVQITFRKYDIRILADFRKDIEWNKGDPVGDGGASIFRKSTNGFV